MSNGQIVPIKEKAATIKSLIERYKPEIAQALPHHVTADRMLRVIYTTIQKTPRILDCTPSSLIGAILETSQLGLTPGILGEAYFVPYRNNKTGKSEVQLIVGYRGLISLARRSGELSTVYAKEVYERDEFDYCFGLDPKLRHKPSEDEDRGDFRYVYAVAHLKDGGRQFDVMTRAEVEKIRARSRAKDSGPWITDYEEMAKKTVLRRLCKLLPTSVELQKAAVLDELAEAGISQELDVIDLPQEQAQPTPAPIGPIEKPKGKLDQIVADRAKAKRTPAGNEVIAEWGEGADPDPDIEDKPKDDLPF